MQSSTPKRAAVGSVLISVQDFSDAELIYNENETRQILKFFWPLESSAIDGLTIDNHARQLAQIAIVAAIEGTYAMSFIDVLYQSMTRRHTSLSALAKKLARNFVRNWWKHTRKQDLEDVRIYETVRISVALNLSGQLSAVYSGVALKSGVSPFFAQKTSYTIWA